MTYELMYIIPATKTEEEVKGVQDEVTAIIGEYTASCDRNESLGKRKLAYPIKGIRYGYYVIACFEAEAEAIQKLDEELRHHNGVLRHMVVKALEGAAKAEIDLPEYEIPETSRRRKGGPKKDAPKRTKKTEEEVEKKVEETKEATDKEIDKKIDDILESDSDNA